MRCERCHGTGHEQADADPHNPAGLPCMSCDGAGVAHCCEPDGMPDCAGERDLLRELYPSSGESLALGCAALAPFALLLMYAWMGVPA